MLPKDATVRSVVPLLAYPEEYVRNVLGSIGKEFQVRIARDGNERWPDYLAEMVVTDDENEIIGVQAIAVHSGRSHKGALADDKNRARPWAEAAMSFEQVQHLIGEIRGFVPRPKRS